MKNNSEKAQTNTILTKLSKQEMGKITGGGYWALIKSANGSKKLAYIRGNFPGEGKAVKL